mgnify:FL=1
MNKYKYIYEESSVDVRAFNIESDIKLTDDEVREIAQGCTLVDNYTYLGGKKGKRFKSTFLGTDYGDNCSTYVEKVNDEWIKRGYE